MNYQQNKESEFWRYKYLEENDPIFFRIPNIPAESPNSPKSLWFIYFLLFSWPIVLCNYVNFPNIGRIKVLAVAKAPSFVADSCPRHSWYRKVVSLAHKRSCWRNAAGPRLESGSIRVVVCLLCQDHEGCTSGLASPVGEVVSPKSKAEGLLSAPLM